MVTAECDLYHCLSFGGPIYPGVWILSGGRHDARREEVCHAGGL
jgi:hypothetical protein